MKLEPDGVSQPEHLVPAILACGEQSSAFRYAEGIAVPMKNRKCLWKTRQDLVRATIAREGHRVRADLHDRISRHDRSQTLGEQLRAAADAETGCVGSKDPVQEGHLPLKEGMPSHMIGRDGCPSNEYPVEGGDAREGLLAFGAMMEERCATGGQLGGVKAEPFRFSVFEIVFA